MMPSAVRFHAWGGARTRAKCTRNGVIVTFPQFICSSGCQWAIGPQPRLAGPGLGRVRAPRARPLPPASAGAWHAPSFTSADTGAPPPAPPRFDGGRPPGAVEAQSGSAHTPSGARKLGRAGSSMRLRPGRRALPLCRRPYAPAISCWTEGLSSRPSGSPRSRRPPWPCWRACRRPGAPRSARACGRCPPGRPSPPRQRLLPPPRGLARPPPPGDRREPLDEQPP